MYWIEHSATNLGSLSSIPVAGVYFSPKLEKKKVQITFIFGRPMDIHVGRPLERTLGHPVNIHRTSNWDIQLDRS